ncbi:DUF4062 domain-containing protein [Mucilaginibacter jinjuensis]|uniref:DUF4062 domain-containing protein n=1 Tax=Mucilaginibacter jinjuensis TaxID=1176721 RepID=A0ABY7T3V3_9SPHI|nr:DUF4062 domain-containing protein [Mucilaginibacter jinjuensis]WCT11056.1 DUF4062 domain-containing protein [Mucilaginibacter jinjuensis]
MSTSEYKFPIFISSPEYNLIDLRAELSNFLGDLGYNPILSSSEGFPDYTPEFEPWESCLTVLDSSFITLLIIDNRYGTPLEWKAFSEIISDKISPTHGEYRFAHHKKKRILVFIRKGLLEYYQIYREAIKKAKGDENLAKRRLGKILPKTLDYRTLEFINEVKTRSPIPWIIEFKNVVDIKKEVQKKLLNELADVFLFKQRNLEAVLRAFEITMQELPEDKRSETLLKIGVTADLLERIDSLTEKKRELELSYTKIENDLKKLKTNSSKGTLEFTSKIVTDQYYKVNDSLNLEKETLYENILTRPKLGLDGTSSVLGSDKITGLTGLSRSVLGLDGTSSVLGSDKITGLTGLSRSVLGLDGTSSVLGSDKITGLTGLSRSVLGLDGTSSVLGSDKITGLTGLSRSVLGLDGTSSVLGSDKITGLTGLSRSVLGLDGTSSVLGSDKITGLTGLSRSVLGLDGTSSVLGSDKITGLTGLSRSVLGLDGTSSVLGSDKITGLTGLSRSVLGLDGTSSVLGSDKITGLTGLSRSVLGLDGTSSVLGSDKITGLGKSKSSDEKANDPEKSKS